MSADISQTNKPIKSEANVTGVIDLVERLLVHCDDREESTHDLTTNLTVYDLSLLIGEIKRLKRKSALKLYVWTNFCPDYRGGLAFALAKDEASARKQIIKNKGDEPYQWGELEIRRIDHRFSQYVMGGS